MALHDPRPAVVERFLLDDFAHTLRLSADLARKAQVPCALPVFAEPGEDAWHRDAQDRADYRAAVLPPSAGERHARIMVAIGGML